MLYIFFFFLSWKLWLVKWFINPIQNSFRQSSKQCSLNPNNPVQPWTNCLSRFVLIYPSDIFSRIYLRKLINNSSRFNNNNNRFNNKWFSLRNNKYERIYRIFNNYKNRLYNRNSRYLLMKVREKEVNRL